MVLVFLFSGTKMRLIGLLHVLSIFMVHTCLGADHQLHRVALFCPVTTNNTGSSTFTINLDGLFNKSLYNEGGNSIYYKTTYHDKDSDEVHGLYLCKGDATKQTCQDCVVSAIEKFVEECHGTKDAIIWFQECLVRYSNRSFSSSMELKPTASMSKASSLNIMEPVKFKKILYKSFSHLIRNASSSTSKYATRTVNISGSVNMYIFGQCIPDLSKEDCCVCLDNAVQLLDYRKQGSGYFYPSCNARFKLHRFSVDSTVATSLPTSDNETGHADIAPTIVHLSSNATNLGKSKEEVIRELIALGAATLTIIAVVLFVYFLQRKWKKNKRDQVNALNLRRLEEVRIGNEYVYDTLQGQNEVETQEFPLDLILEATRHFSDENKIVEGGFGPVYKGILLDGKEIAVKRLARTSGQGLREFKNEVTLIAKLQHKNLVRLLGCCLEGNELLLIYEYMANKSLDFLLFDTTRSVQLDWKMRTSIINGIARGLLYLHEDSRFKVIHRDLKASNILLDHEWNPKISDFGMARTFDDNENETNTSRVVGTYGYMAPEYVMEGLFSVKSDIFSFGVLLLEIISGKKNGGVHLSKYGRSLLNYTWKLWCEGEVLELIDPAIVQSCIPSELLKYTNIGLLCCQENSRDRPTISSVVVMLANENTTLSQPNRPAFSAG